MRPLELLGSAKLLLVWAVLLVHGQQVRGEERLPGWQGEVARQHAGSSNSDRLADLDRIWIETISWSPRAFIYHNFLTHQQCDDLRNLVVKKMERSQVVDEQGKEVIDPVRTSYSASLGFHETPVVQQIEDRIAAWTHLPLSHGEPLEVLRYKNDQKYDAHNDWFGGNASKEAVGDRVATVLMYLVDVEPAAGGETTLPLAQPIDEELQSTEGMSQCAMRMGLAVRPRKGDALLFWNALPNATIPDRLALHSSCPTHSGEKWTATKWLHVRPYMSEADVQKGVWRAAQWPGGQGGRN